jgi:hypothetical protein
MVGIEMSQEKILKVRNRKQGLKIPNYQSPISNKMPECPIDNAKNILSFLKFDI